MKRHPNSRDVCQVLGVALAAAAALVLLLVPVYNQANVTADGPAHMSSQTLIDVMGTPVIAALLIPVALTALPLLVRGRAKIWTSLVTTVALAVFVGLGSASIGWIYIPALAAAVAALVSSLGSNHRVQARHG